MNEPAVTVVIPFRDHEQVVGSACRNLVRFFESHRRPVEVIAVDEGSGDNSHAVLALLAQELPIKVVVGKGFAGGSHKALGATVILTAPDAAIRPVPAALVDALVEVESGRVHVHQVEPHLLVCEVSVAQQLAARTGSWRPSSEQQIMRRARAKGLSVGTNSPPVGQKRPLLRRLRSFVSPRSRVPWAT